MQPRFAVDSPRLQQRRAVGVVGVDVELQCRSRAQRDRDARGPRRPLTSVRPESLALVLLAEVGEQHAADDKIAPQVSAIPPRGHRPCAGAHDVEPVDHGARGDVRHDGRVRRWLAFLLRPGVADPEPDSLRCERRAQRLYRLRERVAALDFPALHGLAAQAVALGLDAHGLRYVSSTVMPYVC